MKKILLLVSLLLISCSQSKNLTLVCDGTLTLKNVVNNTIKTETKKTTNTYIFEDGGIQGKYDKSKCYWDDRKITCVKDLSEEHIYTLTFDKISGILVDHDSLIGYTSDTFEGKCVKGSVKF